MTHANPGGASIAVQLPTNRCFIKNDLIMTFFVLIRGSVEPVPIRLQFSSVYLSLSLFAKSSLCRSLYSLPPPPQHNHPLHWQTWRELHSRAVSRGKVVLSSLNPTTTYTPQRKSFRNILSLMTDQIKYQVLIRQMIVSFWQASSMK